MLPLRNVLSQLQRAPFEKEKPEAIRGERTTPTDMMVYPF